MTRTIALATPFAGTTKTNEAPPAPVAAAEGTAPVAAAKVGEIRKGIPIPEKKGGKGGGPSPYKEKIEALDVGDSFHVAGKTKRSLNSTMHTFNKNFRVTRRNPDGSAMTELKIGKNREGVETRRTVELYDATRTFAHYDVDKTDPDGVGVRIFRVK